MMKTNSDILIIGGGAIGLHVAYYLLEAGHDVTILEKGAVAQGSSAGNAGHIVPSDIIPLAAPGIIRTALKWLLDSKNGPFGMKISLDPQYISWLLRFALSCTPANVERAIPPLRELGLLSAQNISELIAIEGFDCSYRKEGVLYPYKEQTTFENAQHEAELVSRHGLGVHVLDQDALREFEPSILSDVIGGVHYTSDASLDPGKYLEQLAESVQEVAEIHENTPVTGFETANGKIKLVRTANEDFEPVQVVLAAGAWSPGIVRGLRLKLPLQPARGYSMTMSAPDVGPRNTMLLGERKVAITPMGNLLRFTGRLELGNYDTTPNPKRLAGIERAVREYIHLDEDLDVIETWAGLRPTTPDGLPIIGFASHLSNLIIATGHAMLGLSLGPGTGQVVAELVTGQKTAFDIRPLRVDRFA
jgi:D-amino-acid dehydrogenase